MAEYYIGQIFLREYPPQAAYWCNENNCYIDKIEPLNGVDRFEIFENQEETPEEKRQRLNMMSLTKREVFLALYDAKGITPEQVRANITDTAALIEFDYAAEYYRGNPLIDAIGAQLGYTTDDLDYLFENKKLPTGE